MSQWILVTVCTVCALLSTLSLTACDQDASLRDAVVRAIDKTSEVQSFRSTTNKVIFTDNYVRSYSSVMEHAAVFCTFHSSQITVETRVGNATTLPFDRDWYLEAGIPIKWSEWIVVGGSGDIRSSSQPKWCPAFVDCAVSEPPLHSELQLYRFLINLEKLPAEDITGVNCSHYRGSVDFNSYVDWRIEENRDLPMVYLEEGAT